MSPENLADLVIPNRDGHFIRLGEVAEFLTEPGPLNIYHINNERAITITGDIVKDLTTPKKAIEQALVGVDLDRDWPGMRLVIAGEVEETQSSMSSLLVGFIAAGVGVYLLLVLLFNSLVQPFIVMLAIPFGLIGVIAAFALHQQSLGFLAMLGVVGLTGLVVNDSLILVNLVNRLRLEEPAQPFREIIIKAIQARLRPILITSITTVVGLLPMAYGIGGSDPFSAPMALAMGYGILFATPLTLILLPCLLAVLDDASRLYERVYQVLSQCRTAIRLRGRKKMTSRYGTAILSVFKVSRRAHNMAYVTEAATSKTDKRASKVGKPFFNGS
jgi:multidrug efflux pump subunit AcrB